MTIKYFLIHYKHYFNDRNKKQHTMNMKKQEVKEIKMPTFCLSTMELEALLMFVSLPRTRIIIKINMAMGSGERDCRWGRYNCFFFS